MPPRNTGFCIYTFENFSIHTFSVYLNFHYVKSVQIRIFPGPYFPVFGLNMGKKDQKKLRIWSLFTQCFYEGVFFL